MRLSSFIYYRIWLLSFIYFWMSRHSFADSGCAPLSFVEYRMNNVHSSICGCFIRQWSQLGCLFVHSSDILRHLFLPPGLRSESSGGLYLMLRPVYCTSLSVLQLAPFWLESFLLCYFFVYSKQVLKFCNIFLWEGCRFF